MASEPTLEAGAPGQVEFLPEMGVFAAMASLTVNDSSGAGTVARNVIEELADDARVADLVVQMDDESGRESHGH